MTTAAALSLALAMSPDRIEGPNPYGALTTWPVVLLVIAVLGAFSWWATRRPKRRR